MWRLEPGAVAWLVVFSLQLRSLCSRQPGCVSSVSSIGTLTADESSGGFLLWSLGPLLTSVSLFAVLADYGRGRQTAMGLRRIAVASPCLTQLAAELLQPVSAPSQKWWFWPLASAVLVITNQDAAEITAVQASVLYTASVTCAALDFARRTWHVASAASAATADLEASLQRSRPLAQLVARVLVLAALHVVLAVWGLWLEAARSWRTLAPGPGTVQRPWLQQCHQERGQESRGGGQADRRHEHHGATAARGEPEFAPGGNAAGGETAAWEGGQRAAVPRPGTMCHPPTSVCAVHPQGASGAATRPGCGGGEGSAAQIPASAALAGAQAVAQAGAHHQPTKAGLSKQYEVPGLPRRAAPWHSDFAAERRHVVSTRLADAALLACDFLEAYRCFCGGASGGGAGCIDPAGGACGVLPPGALPGPTPCYGAGPGSRAMLRQLRCLGSLLVTSWGTTVLVVNAIIMLWPRPRRSQYAWVFNSACSWLAGLARATLLVVLAPAAAGSAPWVHAPAAPGTDSAAVAAAGGVSGASSLSTGRPVLAAVVVLLTHLFASNLPPRAFNVQAAIATAAGALLHRRLAPASPAQALAVVYGGIWLAAVTLSYSLARACRESQAREGLAGSPLPPPQHRGPVQQQQLPPWQEPSGAAAPPAVAIAGGGGSGGGGVGVGVAEDPLAAVASSVPCGAPIWRVLRPPRLGCRVSRNLGSADGPSLGGAAAAAAASDLALRTLALAGSPRLSSRLQHPLHPTHRYSLSPHTGVSSCAARAGQVHPGQCTDGRAGAPSPQGPYIPGASSRASHGLIGGPASPAAASFGTAMRAGGSRAAGEAAPPRRPQLPLPVPPPAAHASSERTSLDSKAPRLRAPPCRTASLDPRHLPCKPSELTMAAVMSTAEGAAAAAAAAKYPNTVGAPPGRLSRYGKGLDGVAAAATPAVAAAEFRCVSYVRRASSEQPTVPEGPVAVPTPSLLHQASSCGLLHAGAVVPLGSRGAREAVHGAPVAAALMAPGPSHVVVHRGGPGGRHTAGTQPWPMPAMATTTAAAVACRASVASHTAYGSGGDGGGELGAVARAASLTGPSLPLATFLPSNGPVPLSGAASGGGAAASAANEHSVLSSVMLEADMYDRLLSSASSPFLLNPGTATPTTRRLPSVANAGTVPLQSPMERRGQVLHQPPPPPPHLVMQPSYARTSSGLSEAWSAFAPSVCNTMGTASGGGGAFAPGAIAAAGAAAAFGSCRQGQLSDGEDFEVRAAGGDNGSRSGGGGGGGSESGWSRAATGSRSRLDRTAATLVAVAEEAAPRQVIVLADGRQVYQSELLAAAASSSPPGSATPLHGPQTLAALPPPLSPFEQLWTAAAPGLPGPTASSETSGWATMASAVATAGFQEPETAVVRHLSYTARGGGGGSLSCSLDPFSSAPALQVPYSPRSGSSVYWGETNSSAVGEAWRHWAAAAAAAASSTRSPPQAQSPWQLQVQHVQRAVSKGVSAAAPPSPSMYSSGGPSAAASTGRGDRGVGFGQPSLVGGSASGRSPYTTRGGGGGAGGVGGTSASSRFSSSYGPGSGAGSARGAEFEAGGTSGLTSYGTAETGGSLSGGAAGSAGSGGVRGNGALPYHRASIDLGRHLHDTGLIRIGEEEAIVEDEDDECPASILFGTCDGEADGVVGSAAGPGFISSGLSAGFGSGSDRRSSATTDQPSGDTPSGDTSQVVARRDLPRWSYGSSSRGSGATGDATGSVPLAAVGLAAQAGSRQQARACRSRPRVSMAAAAAAPLRHKARAAPDAVIGPAGASSTSGSSWSTAAPRSSADGPTGAGAGSTGRLIGSGASGASYRGLSDSPTLQTLLHIQSATVASSSSLLTQLPLAAATAVVAAAAAVSFGGAVGASGGGGASGVSGGGAAALSLGRNLLSGGSHRSSSNPSLLSFADVTLGLCVAPSAAAVGLAPHTGGCSPRQSAAAGALSGAGVIVTLARGVVAESPMSSAANTGGDGDAAAAAAAARLGQQPAAAATVTIAAAAAASTGGAAVEGANVSKSGSVHFLSYPQTLASMVGSGSMGRRSHSALRASGTAVAGVTASTATSMASGAMPRGSYTHAASPSGRLAIAPIGGGAAAGDARAGSRPTIPELLASTAAAAIGNAPVHGAGAVAASPWASPATSAHLPSPSPAAAAAEATSTAVAPGGAVGKQPSLSSYRLNLFTADEGSSVGEGAVAAEGSCWTGAGSHPTGDTNAMAEPRTASNLALPSQPLPSGPLSSRPLSSGRRRRGVSWFGHFWIPKRTSTLGASGGGGTSGGGFLSEVPSSLPLPLPPPSPQQQQQQQQQQYGRSPTVGEEAPERDGRASVAGRSSQLLPRLMDDTARLSPVRGVLLGLRKRFRSGVKSLSGGRQ